MGEHMTAKPESIWSQIDKGVQQFRDMKPAVARFRRWRFKGQKPDGRWWARCGWGKDATDAFAATAPALIEVLRMDVCEACGHRWARHGGECCTGWYGKGAIRRKCECVLKASVVAT